MSKSILFKQTSTDLFRAGLFFTRRGKRRHGNGEDGIMGTARINTAAKGALTMKLNGISKETMEDIHRFVHERDWEQFHTPKDLAISLSLEAAELLEIFQWSGTDMQCRDKLPHMKEEIADVLVHCIQLCDVLDLDPEEVIRAKMAGNRAKYPVDKAYSSAKKYTELK